MDPTIHIAGGIWVMFFLTYIFDRESISHGPTSLKIVVVGVLKTSVLFIILSMKYSSYPLYYIFSMKYFIFSMKYFIFSIKYFIEFMNFWRFESLEKSEKVFKSLKKSEKLSESLKKSNTRNLY